MDGLRKNDLFTARVDGYSSEGAGVCRCEGRAVFVPGAICGEEWEIRIVRVSSSAVYGRGEKLLAASPERMDPDCPHYPRCGGCSLRHMSTAEESAFKLNKINSALSRIGGLDLRVTDLIPAEESLPFRRKVIFNVAESGGRPVAGFYRARSHEVVPLSECAAIPVEALRCCGAVLRWMEAAGVPSYCESSGQEGIRHIYYRSSHADGSAVLTVTSSFLPGNNETDSLIRAVRECSPEVQGIVINHNRARGNTVLSGSFIPVWGKDVLTERLCGLRFELSPPSFFQVNPPQAEKLYDLAMEMAEIREGVRALDLYCGTGTIALCMASRGASVIGAEIIPSSVENARRNAELNGLSSRCDFILADAELAAAELARRGFRPEVVVVDPPRKGLPGDVIASVVSMGPDRIVYVSCDPATLARDLAVFARQGYRPVSAVAVNMFPRTCHVETVTLLSRRKDEPRIQVTMTCKSD